MSAFDAKEWFRLAAQDSSTAIFLTNMDPLPIENICYNCAQAAEKYLKGFLVYHDIIPQKTHNLALLLKKCIEIDIGFTNIINECDILLRYSNEIRYPDGPDADEDTIEYLLKAINKIANLETIQNINLNLLFIND